MVHQEAMVRLQAAFSSHSFGEELELSEDQAEEVIDTYMMLYILGSMVQNVSTVSQEQVQEMRATITEIYPGWAATQVFVREVRQSVAPHRDYFFYADIANVVEEIGERYGSWQDTECRVMKEHLVGKEDSSAASGGRVRLADFYAPANGRENFSSDFTESPNYLRQLGALDESVRSRPKVLVANYIASPGFCVPTMGNYEVCCLSECEGLVNDLQGKVQVSEVLPQQLCCSGSCNCMAGLVGIARRSSLCSEGKTSCASRTHSGPWKTLTCPLRLVNSHQW